MSFNFSDFPNFFNFKKSKKKWQIIIAIIRNSSSI